MGNSTETELKLQLASPEVWGDILQAWEFFDIAEADKLVQQPLEACYYDTARLDLQQARLAYRIRREHGQWMATVKGGGSSAGGLHQRQEWNIVVPDAGPNIEVFSSTPVGKQLKAAIGNEELKLLFITRFTRHTLNVAKDGSCIEVAADRGEIIAGQHREPILEIELELKEGSPISLLKLGAELAEKYPLLLESRSKYFRGLQLAGLAGDDNYGKKGDQSKNDLAGVTARAISSQAAFIQTPDKLENLISLQEEIQSLICILEQLQSNMPRALFEYFHNGLLRWQKDSQIASMLSTGRYTSLILKLWAWSLEKTPAGK